jgi:A/G-specific adenine glycosylase
VQGLADPDPKFNSNPKLLRPRARRDPYATWISESMLQQTQVDTVLRAYAAWMKAFPTLKALAQAKEEEVLALWSGLGYYRRARNLLTAAKALVESGHSTLPHTRAELLGMAGVGEYTAGAILSLAYGLPEPLLDGNVVRVASRFHGLSFLPDTGAGKAAYWDVASVWANDHEPWAINEALMELGALVCTPRSPRCSACPLASDCVAKRESKTEVLPPAKVRDSLVFTPALVVLLEFQGRMLMTLPQKTKLLRGHWLFPMAWQAESQGLAEGLAAAWLPKGARFTLHPEAGHVSHAITKHKVEVTVRAATVQSLGQGKQGKDAWEGFDDRRWVEKEKVAEILVPSLGHKIWKSYLGLAQQRKPIMRLA